MSLADVPLLAGRIGQRVVVATGPTPLRILEDELRQAEARKAHAEARFKQGEVEFFQALAAVKSRISDLILDLEPLRQELRTKGADLQNLYGQLHNGDVNFKIRQALTNFETWLNVARSDLETW